MDVYHRLFWHGQSNDLFDLPGFPGQTWAWTPSFQDFNRVFTLWFYDHLEVSWNGSTPKSSILVGSIINQPAIGDPKFTELPFTLFWIYPMKSYLHYNNIFANIDPGWWKSRENDQPTGWQSNMAAENAPPPCFCLAIFPLASLDLYREFPS